MLINFSKMTYREMAQVIHGMATEIKHRNPIGVNMYMAPFVDTFNAISEIADGEVHNFTSEHGPKEPKPIKPRKNCAICAGKGFYMSLGDKKRVTCLCIRKRTK